MIHVSLDIETFDKRIGASIATIGAVASDRRTFYQIVTDTTGLFSPETIRWHAEQKDAATNIGAGQEYVGGVILEEPVDLESSLQALSSWLEQYELGEEGQAMLWTHKGFDLVQLQAAYERCDLDVPWHYRNTGDLRTLYHLVGRPTPEQIGGEYGSHNALADAEYQMRELNWCLERLGWCLDSVEQ